MADQSTSNATENPAAGVLKAVASCSADAVRAGEPVVVEMYLQNVGEEEITYFVFKKHSFFDDRWVTTIHVDGRPVTQHTLLDVHDAGYKVIAEYHGSWNIPFEGKVVVYPSSSPISREQFVVLKPGEKVAYLKVDLQPAQFIHEPRKGVLGPLQIPGERTIQIEYHNRADGRQFGLSAWTGKVRSNVVTVKVKLPRSLDEIKLEISTLLSKLEKLEDEHLKIHKEKLDAMSDAEKIALITYNRGVMSGLEEELRTLSEKTARRMVVFGERAVPILLENLWKLSWGSDYGRRCIGDALRKIGRPAVPYLIEDVQGRAPTVKVAHGKYEKVVTAKNKRIIISTLGQIGDSRAVEPLLELFDKNRTSSIRWTFTIVTALSSIGDKRVAEPFISELDGCLIRAEKNGDWDSEYSLDMRALAGALGGIGDKRAIPVLKRALNAGPQRTKAPEPQYLIAEEAARALRSLGVQVEGKDGKYRIVTDPPEEAKPGRVLFSDGREFVGKVFVQGGDNEWQRIERVEQQLKITCRDGRSRSESVYTKNPLLEEVFVKTRDGWRPALGELWPSLDSSTLSRTYIREIIFGGKPSESERQEFHEYRHKYYRDSSEKQWSAHWGKLSKNMPPSWEKLPTSKQQCYRNLAMIEWASYYAWNKPVPVTGDVNLRQLLGWRYLDSPVCPAGGKYSAGPSWAKPECSAHGTPEVFLEAKVEEILNRLYTAMEKAYAEVGLSKRDIQGFLSRQQPPQKAMGKWKSYQETWPAIVKARNAAIAEMLSLGPSAVTVLLEAKDKSDERRGEDIFVSVITRIGKTAVPALIDGLSHVDVVARARAATSLGSMRDKRAVEPLIRSLSDPDTQVVRAAIRSLGLLKDSAATEPLLELWHKGRVVSGTSIASALGQIGDKRAAEPIIAALEGCVSKAQQTGNWDTNSWAMREYAYALGQIGDPQAIGLLKKMLDAPHQRTKSPTPIYLVADAAAWALRKLDLEVTGDREKGGYKLVETAFNIEVESDIRQERIGM
jgi:HEAT repeat protein